MAVSPVTSAELPARVLLVDDDEVNLLLTSAALRERGFDVTAVASGEAGLQQLVSQFPDVVLLDALMPGLDGFEVCQRLRQLPGQEHTPVLMLTGLDDEASIERAYQAGATDFFIKSTQWSLLAGRLRHLLRAGRTRRELEASKSKLARAQDLARMGSLEWRRVPGSRTGRLEVSAEAQRVFGQTPVRQLSVRQVLRMVERDNRRTLLRMLTETQAHGGVLAADLVITLPDGRVRIVHVEAEPEYSEQGVDEGYTGVVQDVTDRRTAEDKIRHLANYDSLTGLPNRRQLMWRTERALDHARQHGHQCAVLLIDLDRFKLINDTLGHSAGDDMLCEVANRLRACVRHSEQVSEESLDAAGARAHRVLEGAGRLGGDEFIALLPDVHDEQDAQRVAMRILESLREPMLVGGQEWFTTASVGIAMYPRDGLSVLDLLRSSDVAMYAVKAAGRNGAIQYSPMLAGKGREKLELETALYKALERQELVLYYQPKVDVRSARMVGVEALMRWQRGDKLVPPGDFIPLAEESGLIVPMSEWALREAARQAKLWSDSFGFADAIAVNMPSRVVERHDLINHIHAAVSAHGLPHRAIQLELTETGLMKELQNVVSSLHRLNEMGVEIAVDDFGTGYSSLAYLTTLPISELKIDRSFVRDIGVTPQSSAVVTAIIALSRSLGLRVVAEGVESLRQMEVLHRLGCFVMQGFLFSRPLPPLQLEEWLQNTMRPRKAPWMNWQDKEPNVIPLLRPAVGGAGD
ncbi:MAG: EAL domain-containing protein [Rubrivivax sp.]|jgi:PAS domain S-box-containing protein|nr:EAL domain-containing protein [Rubrivivax sp.]